MKARSAEAESKARKDNMSLLFDLEKDVSPAVRVRHTTGPYLDRMASTPHMPHADKAGWRGVLIPAVTIPDLSHTGVRTALGAYEPELMRPDGTVGPELRRSIAAKLQQFPDTGESRDMAVRDLRRSQRPGRGQRLPKSSNLRPLEDTSTKQSRHRDDQPPTIVDLVFDGQATGTGRAKRRAKRPYSTASLATLLLDAEYGKI